MLQHVLEPQQIVGIWSLTYTLEIPEWDEWHDNYMFNYDIYKPTYETNPDIWKMDLENFKLVASAENGSMSKFIEVKDQ